jgi:hypothetical protein
MKLPVSDDFLEVFGKMGGNVLPDLRSAHHVIGVDHVAYFTAEKKSIFNSKIKSKNSKIKAKLRSLNSMKQNLVSSLSYLTVLE